MNGSYQALEQFFVRASREAAIAARAWVGKGDKIAADQAAVTQMRRVLTDAPMQGRVVIGEGERDEAPMLYIGEQLGLGDVFAAIDIAVDPLDGTSVCAQNLEGAICVIAYAPKGALLAAPDIYMDKLAFGPDLDLPPNALDWPLPKVIETAAQQLGKSSADLRLCMLDRPRHQGRIDQARALGAKVHLIQDGDVIGALLTALPSALGGERVDLYVGSGGAAEGVLAAAGLQALDGTIYGRLLPNGEAQRARVIDMGMKTPDSILATDDLAGRDAVFIASGVTRGAVFRHFKAGSDGAKGLDTLIISKRRGASLQSD